MNEQVQNLKSYADRMKAVNAKLKLLILLERAKSEYDENHFENCKETCLKALEVEPNNPVALRGIGCVNQFCGNYEEAVKYYQKALDNSKNKEIEYTLLGTVYYALDDYDKAIEYYNKAIEINDNYDSAYEGRNQSMLENHLKVIDLQDSLIKQKIF